MFSRSSITVPELLAQVEQVTSARLLNILLNRLQMKLFHLPASEQVFARARVTDKLAALTLQASDRALRLEAAGWMRMLVQASYLAQPSPVFEALVAATIQASASDRRACNAYLQMIVDCFWPFRQPYASLAWEAFPVNRVFTPLLSLLSLHDDYIEDTLVIIFSFLPTLDIPDQTSSLLPLALAWARHPDSERRQRSITLLSHLNHPDAQAALVRLCSDSDAYIRTNAERACENAQPA